MTVKLYNTLSNQKEEFDPIEEGKVKIYSCGQTIYDDMHIGNAKTYAAWDILNRYLEWKGYDVFHVMNITDVGHLTDDADEGEDKVEKAARERKLEPMELVTEQVRKWYIEMDELNMKRHNVNPRATGHMIEMIEAVKDMIENGYAYEENGTVYFDVRKFDKYHNYPKLGGRTIEDLKTGAGGRVSEEELEEKKSPLDFALWIKADRSHIMKWPSPWSLGYPGWHLECSVMGAKYLGKKFDIHSGGVDHIFPHHPNERAQNMAMEDMEEEPVNYWLHSEHITVEGEKMSKSKGNFYTVLDLLEKFDAEVIRTFFASIHYRSQSDFSFESLKESEKKLERFYRTIRNAESSEGGDGTDLEEDIIWIKKEFEEAMDDDLNTPLAMSKLIEFSKRINKKLDNKEAILEEAADTLKELGRILGLKLKEKDSTKSEDGDPEEYIEMLVKMRERLREKGEYELGDEIREKLKNKDVRIEDTEEGPRWYIP
ncbi:MAG: cysteine--tRNA ligase [Candidatus Thermoplasmatota archaeon]